MRLIIRCTLAVLLLLPIPAYPCAMLSLVEDGQVLFGNNEDEQRRGVIWFVPGDGERLGRVNVGFNDDFAQGSMNERGLAFDSAVVNSIPWPESEGKEAPHNLLELVMNSCGTVTEALAMFERYHCRHLAEAQFFFADASGDSAVVAGLPGGGLSVVRAEDGLNLATNNRLEASGYRCQRFVRVHQSMTATAEQAPRERVRLALESIHQRQPTFFTSYANIFDLKAREVLVYNLGNFEEVVTFNLDEELSKGKMSHRLRKLFDGSPSPKDFKENPRKIVTRIEVPEEVLARYAGEYLVKANAQIPEAMVLQVTVSGGRLQVARQGGDQPLVVYPESETGFRAEGRGEQLVFDLDGDQVNGFDLYAGGHLYAVRQ